MEYIYCGKSKTIVTVYISILSLVLFFAFFYQVIMTVYAYLNINVDKDNSIRSYIINGVISIILTTVLILTGFGRSFVLVFIVTAQLKLHLILMLNRSKKLDLIKQKNGN